MGNIIGLSGRMRSGKGELSDICVKHGYIRLYYALPLKILCARILRIDVDQLNFLKNRNERIDYTLTNIDFDFLSEETKIPIEEFKDFLEDVRIETVRDMLQLIGTDVIRRYDENWHVNKIRKMIKENENYVIDDVRFPNEKKLIDDLNGDCWFIIRPSVSIISHHSSEESLSWMDFNDKVIVNDGKLDSLRERWDKFISDYKNNVERRNILLTELSLQANRKPIEPLSEAFGLFLNNYMFDYKKRDYEAKKMVSVQNMSNGKDVMITYEDGTIEIVGNPYNIEDLKFFI